MTQQTDRLNTALAGRYRILRHLGEGGMASVYLCDDIKHDRKVALKLLKPELAAVLGAKRFVQEIKTTAALQHPHILPLFDSGAADGFLFYVMPFIDGETLRARLDRETQLGVDDAVRIAREVLDALHYAHEHGIVHRDVKPENILLHGGHAMVADFGIALAVSAAAGGRMTETGLSLGTPHYMSPEQATAEKDISARSDVYSLGSVLYEMLTGQPPHLGGSAQQIIMKIITTPADLVTTHRKSVPPHVAAAVATSLEKLPADRFESAKAFSEALANPAYRSASGDTGVVDAVAGRHGVSMRLLVAVAAGLLLLFIWAWLRPTDERTARVPIRAVMPLPANVTLAGTSCSVARGGSCFNMLPGDSLIVFEGQRDSVSQLYVMRLGDGQTSALPGTVGGYVPFASPDGRSIGFFTQGQVWRLALAGGVPAPVARIKAPVAGVWTEDNRFVVGEDEGTHVTAVPVEGGRKDTLPLPRAEGFARIAKGRLLIIAGSRIWVGSADGTKARLLTNSGVVDSSTAAQGSSNAPRANAVQCIAPGFLAWLTPERLLMVAPFDVKALRFTGPAVVLADSVDQFSASANGPLVMVRGRPLYNSGLLVSADRSGRADTLPYPPANYRTFDVSPDGRRLAVVVATDDEVELRFMATDRAASQVWRGFAPGSVPHEPRWSPDGEKVALKVGNHLVIIKPDAGTADTVYRGIFIPHRWTPDGLELAGSVVTPRKYGLLSRFRPGSDKAPRTVLELSGNEWYQSFSPDGRWMAFQSTGFRAEETGTFVAENHVGALPIRIGAFDSPVWSSDGREIFGLDDLDGWVYSVPVTTGPPAKFGAPVRLFRVRDWVDVAGQDLVVSRQGRFIYRQGAATQPITGLTVLTEWAARYAELKGSPAKR